MTNDIKIEKDIPIPKKYTRHKYPFREMEVGDSFFVAFKAYPAVAHAAKRTGRRYICKTVIENGVKGLRVWRIE